MKLHTGTHGPALFEYAKSKFRFYSKSITNSSAVSRMLIYLLNPKFIKFKGILLGISLSNKAGGTCNWTESVQNCEIHTGVVSIGPSASRGSARPVTCPQEVDALGAYWYITQVFPAMVVVEIAGPVVFA